LHREETIGPPVVVTRIEYVSSQFPQWVFAFDEFGPPVIRPQAGV